MGFNIAGLRSPNSASRSASVRSSFDSDCVISASRCVSAIGGSCPSRSSKRYSQLAWLPASKQECLRHVCIFYRGLVGRAQLLQRLLGVRVWCCRKLDCS